MSDKTPNFRPYINPEMVEYENIQAFKDFVESFTKPISDEDFNEIENRITEFVEVDFYKNNPEGVLETGDIKPSYKSKVFNFDKINELTEEEYSAEFGEEDLFLTGLYLYRDLEIIDASTEFVVLDELRVKYGEVEIDLYALLPEGYKILLIDSGIIGASEVNFKFKYILLEKDINTLGGLLVLLHEIGHVINDSHEYEDRFDSESSGEEVSDEVESESEEFSLYEPKSFQKHIVSERDASLFALKKIWKELRKHPEQKRDAINYLRYFFSTYCVSYLEDSAYNNEVKES